MQVERRTVPLRDDASMPAVRKWQHNVYVITLTDDEAQALVAEGVRAADANALDTTLRLLVAKLMAAVQVL